MAEIGTTGWFTVDFTAAAMTGNTIAVQVTASNANAVYFKRVIIPADLTEITGHWFDATVKRIEKGIMQMTGYFYNKIKRNKTTGLVTVYQSDASTAIGTMTRDDTSTEIIKNELS